MIFSSDEEKTKEQLISELVELRQRAVDSEATEAKHKRTDEAVREANTLLEKTFASLSEAVFVVDPATRTIISCNPAVERIFGYSEQEVVGRNTEFLHVDREMYEKFGLDSEPALSADGVFHTEFQMRRKDGIVFFTEHTVTEIADDAGSRTGVVSVVRDITQQVEAERGLQIKTEQLAAVVNSMTTFLESGDFQKASALLISDALKQTDSEYGFIGVVVEGRVLRILAHEGIVWDAVAGREFYDEAVRTYREVGYLEFTNFENLFGKVITSGETVVSNDPGGDPRSGGLPPGHPPLQSFLGVPILSGTEVVGLIGVANRPEGYTGAEQTNIEILSRAASVLYDSYRRQEREAALKAERKQAEEAIRTLKEFNENVVQSIQDGVVTLDRDFRITFWNKAMEEISGYLAVEVIGHVAYEVFPHLIEQRVVELYEAALEGQVVSRFNTPYQTPRGKAGYSNAWYLPLKDQADAVIGVLAIVEDVTDTVQLEEQVTRLQQEIEQRKLVEIAKGILMREMDISEDASYQYIQKKSQDERMKMVEVAKRVIESFGSPEERKKIT